MIGLSLQLETQRTKRTTRLFNTPKSFYKWHDVVVCIMTLNDHVLLICGELNEWTAQLRTRSRYRCE